MKLLHNISIFICSVILLLINSDKLHAVNSYTPWEPEIVKLFEAMPVQEEGRLKPMQTVARYKLLRINNSKRLSFTIGNEKIRISATEWLMDCLFRPEVAKELPIFKINNPAVIESIGVTSHASPRERYSYNEIYNVPDAMRLLSERSIELGKKINDQDNEEESKEVRRNPVNAGILSLKSSINEFEWAANAFNFARSGIDVDLGEISEDFKKSGTGKTKISYFVEKFDKIVELARGPEGQKFIDQISGAFQMLERDTATAGVKDMVSMISLAMFPPQPQPQISDDEERDEEWVKPGYFIEQLTFRSTEMNPEQKLNFSEWAIPYLVSLEKLASFNGNQNVFKNELEELSAKIINIAEERGEYKNINLELLNNKLSLFHWSLPFYIMAFLLLAISWLKPGSRVSNSLIFIVWGMAIFATLCLVVGICMRSLMLGRPPISTLYETIPFITVVAVILCLLIEFFDRKGIALASSLAVGIIGIFLTWRFEIKEARDTLKVLEAVLRSNFWLATHVIAINIGYAAALLAGLIAHIFIFSKRFKMGSDDLRRSITKMVYGITCFGLLFALVGTVLGGVWANDSWGRFWGWDPKENGALMICLGALIMLHARMGGYIKDLGMNIIAVLILVITVFSWWHVNQLETGLHSYGFTSGIMFWLYVVYAIECGVMAIGISCYNFKRKNAFNSVAFISLFLLAFIFAVTFMTLAVNNYS